MSTAQTFYVADTWGMHGDVGTGWMILMMALMVLFWGGLIVAIVLAVRYLGGSRHGGGDGTAQAPPRAREMIRSRASCARSGRSPRC